MRSPTNGKSDSESAPIEGAIRNLQQGIDADRSFRLLYDRYYPSVSRHLERKGVGPDHRPDLIQIAFFQIYKGIGGLKDPARFEAFLLTATQRVFLKWLEQIHGNRETIGGRSRVAPDDEEILDYLVSDEPWPIPLNKASSPEGDARYQELLSQVRQIIDQMPPAMSRIAKMRFVHGLSNKEITKVLDKKPGDVGYQLHQARKRLGKELRGAESSPRES